MTQSGLQFSVYGRLGDTLLEPKDAMNSSEGRIVGVIVAMVASKDETALLCGKVNVGGLFLDPSTRGPEDCVVRCRPHKLHKTLY